MDKRITTQQTTQQTTHTTLINQRTSLPLSQLPVLTNSETYIYILENDANLIKIGQSKNPLQRINSLSGSNSQGHKITKVYVSEPTYLSNMEKVMHQVFRKNRIPNTEWFEGLSFVEVCMELNEQMNNETYYKLNSLRATFLSK